MDCATSLSESTLEMCSNNRSILTCRKRRTSTGSFCPQILLLGSIDAELRRDAQLEGSQLRFLAQSSQLADALGQLGVEELEVHCLARSRPRKQAFVMAESNPLSPWELDLMIKLHVLLHDDTAGGIICTMAKQVWPPFQLYS